MADSRIIPDPPFAWAEGAPYSQAVRVGDLVFTSGQGGFDAEGNLVEGIEAQLRLALANLDVSLQAAGASLGSLIKITLYLANPADLDVWRAVRAETLSLKARDFTRAAVALGARPGRIMFRHILPNTAGTLVVATTMSVGTLILFESTLSFLGLGIQPPAASWGNMLTGAQELLQEAPMLALWPGLLIFLTVIAFNFLGDGLQDALDPRSERR